MQKIGCLLIAACIVLFPSPLFAQSPTWKVKPSICISRNVGDRCRMDIHIEFGHLAPGDYCLYQGKQKLQCLTENTRQLGTTVTFSHNIDLTLIDSSGIPILTHPLTIKVRHIANTRRRIKQPWSVF